MSEDTYWESLVVWAGDEPLRKLSLAEALAIHPGKNPLTLDRDTRRAWARLVGPSEKVVRSTQEEPAPLLGKLEPRYTNEIQINHRDGPTRFVALFDLHWPYNVYQPQIEQFLRDFKPHELIYGGDAINNDAFNHWAEKTPKEARIMPAPKEHYRQANEQLFTPLAEAARNARITYMMGNHEDWTNRAIADEPKGEGYWEVERNIEHVDAWVRPREILRLGKLYMAHGDVVQNSTVSPARGLILKGYTRNIIMGHLHTWSLATVTNPIDVDERHVTEYVPCLCEFNPPFMANRPHAWMNGFVFGYVEQDGSFFKQTVIITDGTFYANGKRYSA